MSPTFVGRLSTAVWAEAFEAEDKDNEDEGGKEEDEDTMALT
jgi:hypothetical protein